VGLPQPYWPRALIPARPDPSPHSPALPCSCSDFRNGSQPGATADRAPVTGLSAWPGLVPVRPSAQGRRAAESPKTAAGSRARCGKRQNYPDHDLDPCCAGREVDCCLHAQHNGLLDVRRSGRRLEDLVLALLEVGFRDDAAVTQVSQLGELVGGAGAGRGLLDVGAERLVLGLRLGDVPLGHLVTPRDQVCRCTLTCFRAASARPPSVSWRSSEGQRMTDIRIVVISRARGASGHLTASADQATATSGAPSGPAHDHQRSRTA
jgi:hypothetical protein